MYLRSALMSDDFPVLGTPTTIRMSGSAPPLWTRAALPPLSVKARADSNSFSAGLGVVALWGMHGAQVRHGLACQTPPPPLNHVDAECGGAR